MRRVAGLVVAAGLSFSGPAEADVLWDNGSFDGRNGVLSVRGHGVYDGWVADDFISPLSVRIDRAKAEFYVYEPEDTVFERADIAVWEAPVPGGEPGDLVVELADLPINREVIGEGYGLPIIAVTVEGLEIDLDPGDYYFGMRLVDVPPQDGWAWMTTTGNGTFQGHGPGWVWAGHPFFRWAQSREILGYDSDFAFRLEGVPEPGTAALIGLGILTLRRRP